MNTEKNLNVSPNEEKPIIEVEPLLGEVHSCLRCKWLYFNEGENQQDCGLGYLGKLVNPDIKQQNDCDDFEKMSPNQ